MATSVRLAVPPGPRLSPLRKVLYRPARNPLEFYASLARDYGDLAFYRMGGERVFFVNDPRHIKDILVTHNQNFRKGRGLEGTRPLLGKGLLTNEGESHLRQRRLMQPAFHRDRIAAYAATMVDYAERATAGWVDGSVADISHEMTRLTLSIAGKTLFDVDVEQQAAEVRLALRHVMESFWTAMLPFSALLEHLPVPQLRRARAARARLDRIIYAMIAERRALGLDVLARRTDLLSMLLLATDEGSDQRRTGMSDKQVRDEAMTIFLAGHETTANALAWTWYLLSGAPGVQRRLHEEVDRVLGGRLPAVSDLPDLRYTKRIVTESMRLFPPAWILGRRAIREYPIGGYLAPARSLFLMCQWVTHRDARFFPEPEVFDPDRWTPEFKSALPKFAYYPFGDGPRQCIGESFAWMELVLVVATIARRWSLSLVPNQVVTPQPLVTLRIAGGLPMILNRRE